jgi:hypothetical protein
VQRTGAQQATLERGEREQRTDFAGSSDRNPERAHTIEVSADALELRALIEKDIRDDDYEDDGDDVPSPSPRRCDGGTSFE